MTGRFIAAIAGSAGSHQRLLEFFDHTPHDDVSYVILQHLPVNWRSQLTAILARHTNLSIGDIRHGMILHKDRIYIAPSSDYAVIRTDIFALTHRNGGVQHTADLFMRSLAANSGRRAIGIVLEGTLSDGTLGLQHIREAGGLTIAQDPDTCRFCSMPESAIGAGVVDKIAAIKDMPGMIHEYVRKIQGRTLA